MDVITTSRLVLRRFKDSGYDDLFEFLSQLKDDEFEGYPDITYDNCKKRLSERVGSDEYCAVVLKEDRQGDWQYILRQKRFQPG